MCCWIKAALSSNLLLTGRAVLPQQTWIDIYICVKKANCIWTHNADKRSLMGLTSKMILPPEKPLQDDTTNCVKSCLMKQVPPQGSQVRLHNYRELGHQHSSHNTHDIHQETNTSGDERPRKQTMIYHPFSILLFSSRLCRFSLIINMKSKLTLFTVLINCVSWCTICRF